MDSFSILGDSISTYQGYNPPNFSVYYDPARCIQHGIQSVQDTWWARVIQHYHGNLSGNNSYSGSKVSGRSFPAANQMARLTYLKAHDVPDFLLVYLGCNDFGYGVPLNPSKFHFRKNAEYFDDAYDILLKNLKKLLPGTAIICATLLKTYMANDAAWSFPENFNGHTAFTEYNDAIRRACHKNAVCLADLSSLNLKYETLDGTHPTAQGHQEIACAWIQALAGLK